MGAVKLRDIWIRALLCNTENIRRQEILAALFFRNEICYNINNIERG